MDTGVCYASKAEKGAQIQILLERLPPLHWILSHSPQHYQHFQGFQHFRSRSEMEESLHWSTNRSGHCCCYIGDFHMVCSGEEEKVEPSAEDVEWG